MVGLLKLVAVALTLGAAAGAVLALIVYLVLRFGYLGAFSDRDWNAKREAIWRYAGVFRRYRRYAVLFALSAATTHLVIAAIIHHPRPKRVAEPIEYIVFSVLYAFFLTIGYRKLGRDGDALEKVFIASKRIVFLCFIVMLAGCILIPAFFARGVNPILWLMIYGLSFSPMTSAALIHRVRFTLGRGHPPLPG